MSPTYRARGGSGLFGSYAYPDTRPRIDVGSALDAIGDAATNLIRQAYIRRYQEGELAYRRQRDAIADERYQQERTDRLAQADRDFALRQQTERHRFIEAGGSPASETYDTTPSSIDIAKEFNPTLSAPTPTGVNASPIERAMFGSTPPSVAPAPAQAPTAPRSRLQTTPESYDPTRSAPYVRGVALQDLRNAGMMTRAEFQAGANTERDTKRAAQQQAARDYARGTTLAAIRLRAQLAKAKGNIGAAMTPNAAEKVAEQTALGLIDKFDGSADDAQDFLEHTKEGQDLANATGVGVQHLLYARSQWMRQANAAALRLQSGLAGLEPDSAVIQVDSTRRLLSRRTTAPAIGTSPSAGAASSPSTPRTTRPNEVPGNINLAQPPKASGRDTSSSGDDFTDEEVLDAYTHGKRTDKTIREHIRAQRATRRPH